MPLTLTTEEERAEARNNERCGAYCETVIFVWECGDDICDCSEVQVIARHDHALFPRGKWDIPLAHGTFCTNGEGDVDGEYASDVWKRECAEARVLFPFARDMQFNTPATAPDPNAPPPQAKRWPPGFTFIAPNL